MFVSDILKSLRFEHLEYSENHRDAIGHLSAKIRFLDYETDKIAFVRGLDYNGQVAIVENIIERVAQPVDGYEEDLEINDLGFGFGFDFHEDNEGAYVEIAATVRV